MKRVLLLLVVVLSVSGCRPFHKWYAGFTNDIKQEYLIQDAGKRIDNYEWFYAQYAEIEATKRKVKILAGQPEESGTRMVLESMIGEYNARSRMTVTRELWKGKDLPYQIEGDF